jgi:hypothetical protein
MTVHPAGRFRHNGVYPRNVTDEPTSGNVYVKAGAAKATATATGGVVVITDEQVRSLLEAAYATHLTLLGIVVTIVLSVGLSAGTIAGTAVNPWTGVGVGVATSLATFLLIRGALRSPRCNDWLVRLAETLRPPR